MQISDDQDSPLFLLEFFSPALWQREFAANIWGCHSGRCSNRGNCSRYADMWIERNMCIRRYSFERSPLMCINRSKDVNAFESSFNFFICRCRERYAERPMTSHTIGPLVMSLRCICPAERSRREGKPWSSRISSLETFETKAPELRTPQIYRRTAPIIANCRLPTCLPTMMIHIQAN